MHPVRVETLDLLALTHTLDHGQGVPPVQYPLAWVEHTPYGLHCGRAFHGHPTIAFMERHVLPGLGLLVNRFTLPDGQAHSRYYVDVAGITPGEHLWESRDWYLDLVMTAEDRMLVDDTEEYLAAVQEGLLTPDEAAAALVACHRAVNGVLTCGSLDHWLAREGIELKWRGAPANVVTG